MRSIVIHRCRSHLPMSVAPRHSGDASKVRPISGRGEAALLHEPLKGVYFNGFEEMCPHLSYGGWAFAATRNTFQSRPGDMVQGVLTDSRRVAWTSCFMKDLAVKL